MGTRNWVSGQVLSPPRAWLETKLSPMGHYPAEGFRVHSRSHVSPKAAMSILPCQLSTPRETTTSPGKEATSIFL